MYTPAPDPDTGYYCYLGYLVADDLHAMMCRGLTPAEVQAAYADKLFKPSKRALQAIKVALDPTGSRGVDPRKWLVYRAPDRWLFVERSKFTQGMTQIKDSRTIAMLDRELPNPILLYWRDHPNAKSDPTRTPVVKGQPIGDIEPRSKNAECVNIPPLSKDQISILKVLYGKPAMHHSRDDLAVQIDPDGSGVDEKRISTATSRKNNGLRYLGLVTHSRATGYSLTDRGKKIASLLSS